VIIWTDEKVYDDVINLTVFAVLLFYFVYLEQLFVHLVMGCVLLFYSLCAAHLLRL